MWREISVVWRDQCDVERSVWCGEISVMWERDQCGVERSV